MIRFSQRNISLTATHLTLRDVQLFIEVFRFICDHITLHRCAMDTARTSETTRDRDGLNRPDISYYAIL